MKMYIAKYTLDGKTCVFIIRANNSNAAKWVVWDYLKLIKVDWDIEVSTLEINKDMQMFKVAEFKDAD